MSIGTRVMQLRNHKNISQRELSQRSGIAISYLSRIENRHLEPRPKTLRKIAEALEVPLTEFFQGRDMSLTGPQCVITASGQCVMDMTCSSRGKRRPTGGEMYTPRHLELLRMTGYLIQNGDSRVLDALELFLGALLSTTRLRPGPTPSMVPQPMLKPSEQQD